MTVDKEILEKIKEKQKEKELKAALKQVKKGKKKQALTSLVALLGMGWNILKAVVVWTAKKLVFIFKGLNALREAINLHIELDITKNGPTNPAKLRRKIFAGMTAMALVGLVTGLLLDGKLKNEEVVVKETKGESVVMASEISEEGVEEIDSVKDSKKTKSVQQNQGGKTKSVVKEVLSKDVTMYIVGDISSKFELGEGVSKGSMVDSGKGEIKYGQLSSLTSREDDVLEFCRYLRTNYNDVFTQMFSTAKEVGSKEFNECWKKASEYNEFINIQIEYKWNNFVKPVIDTIAQETKVDLNKTLVGQEIVYSTVNQYGSEKAIQILKNSNLNSSMGEIEVINAIQDEKINSLGNYTYTDAESYDNAYRELIKNRINNERIELTRLLGKPSDSIK